MFFILSKLLIPLESASDLLLLLLIIGLAGAWSIRLRRAGLVIATLAALGFCAVALLPVSSWTGAPLENRFPPPRVLPEKVDGIIVLGGATNPQITAARGMPALNAEAERMIAFVRLAKRYSEAKLVFSGGDGLLDFAPPAMTEADTARLFFRQQGLDTARVIFEDRSRNTYENVLFSKALAKPLPGQVWLLVASARDVPRSVGIFRRLGWPVTPVPVAYKSGGANRIELGDHLYDLDKNAHEWLGLLVYRLTGKTDSLFPGPR